MTTYTVQALKLLTECDENVKNDLLSLILLNDFADIDLATEAILCLRQCATKPECQNWFKDANFCRWFCDIASKATLWADGDARIERSRRLLWQFLFNVSVGKSEFIFDSREIDNDSKNVFNDVFLSTFRRATNDDKVKEVLAGIIHQGPVL